MTVSPAHLDQARTVADAILYEGYLLYPYRKSAQKNQSRFQFGVLMPPAYGAVDPCEPSASQAECLLECGDDARIWILARFLHLRRRTTGSADPGDGWDEAIDREHRVAVSVDRLLRADAVFPVHVPGGQQSEAAGTAGAAGDGGTAGRVIYRWEPLDAVIRVHAERLPGPYGVLRLRVRLENRTATQAPPRVRPDGLRHALISAHTIIGAEAGTFLSLTDPPEWAAGFAAGCVNTGTWPVLAGPAECGNLMIASPIILYDHPQIAPESAGDLFDATEIDEILTLRTLAMTDAEKAEARATDPRAAGLLDRLDGMPPEMLEKMHGAVRYLGGNQPSEHAEVAEHTEHTEHAERPAAPQSAPWWDPGSDRSVSPQSDHVLVGGVRVARGSKVIMRPGSRRADAQDLFLAGREALVQAVLFDVDGQVHVAVSPSGDPLAELQSSHGRFLYFAPDEIEPKEEEA